MNIKNIIRDLLVENEIDKIVNNKKKLFIGVKGITDNDKFNDVLMHYAQEFKHDILPLSKEQSVSQLRVGYYKH